MGNSPGPVNSPHKWPVTRKIFPFVDVIMNGQLIFPCQNAQGLYSIRSKTPYRNISWSFEVARFRFRFFQSLWQTPRQQRCQDAWQISKRDDHYNIHLAASDFTKFGGKSSYLLVNRGPEYGTAHYQMTFRISNISRKIFEVKYKRESGSWSIRIRLSIISSLKRREATTWISYIQECWRK